MEDVIPEQDQYYFSIFLFFLYFYFFDLVEIKEKLDYLKRKYGNI